MNFNFLRIAPVNLLRYLPKALARDEVFKNTFDICSDQHEKMRLKLMDIARQFFVESATWGLDDWERVLAIPTVRSDGYQSRRKRILLKLQGCQTSSLSFMNALLNRYTARPTGYIVEHNEKYTFDVLVDVDTVTDWPELVNALDTYKPAHLAMYLIIQLFLHWEIHHSAECMHYVTGIHNPWNLGKVRTVRFDGEFAMDRAIRWDGIYGEAYRQRQQHHVELWYNIEAWQRNLAPVNVWDGDFPMDGSHTWSGMALLRLPLHKSSSRSSVAARHTRANEWNNRIFAMNCPDVYLPNTVNFNSDSMQAVVAPQKVASRQVSKCLESVIAPQAQKRRQKTAVMQNQQTAEEINIEYRAAIVSQVIARRNADYRFANLADGSFCMDGTHTFNGTRQQNYAQAGHCCSIARVTEKGIGRIELA